MPRKTRAAAFVAIDFETANNQRNSACAVAVVRVENSRVVAAEQRLIRPPTREFLHSGIHGIHWRDVQRQPTFGAVWSALAPLLEGVTFMAAHNAPFDRSVLRACCADHGLHDPVVAWLDTVVVARQTWGLRPATLPDVCSHLGIPLNHHDALSDASACAAIVLAAKADRASV